MPDSLLLPICLDRLVDSNGDILASGTVEVYDAGTTDEKTVYSNSTLATPASNPIEADAGGWLDARYIGTGAYKLVIKDSDGATVKTIDNLPGALDTSGFTPTFAKPDTPVINKSSDYTIIASDLGKVVNVDPTGGSIVITLISAVTAGDGGRITIRHVGTANTVTVVSVSSQTIDGATSRALTAQYESWCLVSDGANWYIDGYAPPIVVRGVLPFLKITDRLTSPPSSPTSGARYILNGSGSGAWSVYSEHDVLESNGQGGWIRYTPAEGWFGYVEDENLYTAFIGTAWSDQTGMPTPSATTLAAAVFQDQKADGQGGGTAVSGAWTARTLNTSVSNTITGCSLATNAITLPAGTYLINASSVFFTVDEVRIRFKSTTTSKQLLGNTVKTPQTDNIQLTAVVSGVLTLTESEAFELQYYGTNNNVTNGLGRAAPDSEVEVFSTVQILSLAAQQGPQGSQGAQGPQGFAGFKFTFSTSTTMTDPGAGVLRLNNGTLSSVTAGVIHATSAETGNPDVSDEVAAWDDGGILKITKVGAEQNWATYNVTNVVDQATHLELTLTYRDHAGSFSNADSIAAQFIPKGEPGVTGATIPIFDYRFNTATAGDPGSGELLFNNATLSSATTISVSDTDRLGADRSADVAAWDDNGASSNRGYIYVLNATTGVAVATFKATGSITDNATYQTMSVEYVSGAAVANDTRVAVVFVPAGATGAIGGSTGAADNRVLVADGAGGTTIKASPVTIDGSGNASGIASLATTTIELGNTDTTLSRSAAGTLAVEGVNVLTTETGIAQGKHTIYVPASAMLSATTSGPASAQFESSSNYVNFKVLDFDASADEHAHFNIQMPKSWDEWTITFKVEWMSSATDTDGVAWGLQAVAVGDNEPTDASWGTPVVVTDDAQSNASELYVTSESTAVTVGGTPAAGKKTFFRVFRDVSDPNDDMTEDARLIGVTIFYYINASTDK